MEIDNFRASKYIITMKRGKKIKYIFIKPNINLILLPYSADQGC